MNVNLIVEPVLTPVLPPVRQPLDLSNLVTSNFVSPKTLAIFRGLALAYAIIVYTCNMINYRNALLYFFTQFTCLAYIGLIAYLMISFRLSYLYLKDPNGKFRVSVLEKYPSARFSYALLYTTTQVFHVVIPILYWTVILRTAFEYTSVYQLWLSISLHGGNSILTLTELCFNRMWLSWIHVPLLLLIVMLYFGLAWIYYAYTGHSTYMAVSGFSPMGTLLLRYTLVLGIFIVMYIVVYYLHRVRAKLGQGSKEIAEHTDEETIEVVTHRVPTEPKPATWSNRSVLTPSSQAQTLSHVLAFF